jgi:uncharacterized membrane protein
MKELLHALVRVYSEPPQQWHPWLIHFPIVFLLLDGLFTVMFWFNPRAEYERWSLIFLGAALVTMVLAILAGLHDSGLDLGAGNVFLLGLQDRWQNAFVFRSSVTVHMWLSLALFALSFARFTWRKCLASALCGPQAFAYGATLFLNLWLLIATTHVGAMLNHK